MSAPGTAIAGAPRLRLTNLETGDQVTLESADQLTPAEAYHLHVNLDTFIQELFWWRKRCSELIEEDIAAEPGRTEVIRDGIVYRYAGDESWVVDPEKLRGALEAVAAAHPDQLQMNEIEAAVRLVQPEPVWKVDNRILNGLAKRRGETVENAIAEGRRRVTGAPKLTIERVPK